MKAVTTCPRLELEKMQGTKGHTPNTIRARTIIELNLNVVQILQLGGAHLNGNEKNHGRSRIWREYTQELQFIHELN